MQLWTSFSTMIESMIFRRFAPKLPTKSSLHREDRILLAILSKTYMLFFGEIQEKCADAHLHFVSCVSYQNQHTDTMVESACIHQTKTLIQQQVTTFQPTFDLDRLLYFHRPQNARMYNKILAHGDHLKRLGI